MIQEKDIAMKHKHYAQEFQELKRAKRSMVQELASAQLDKGNLEEAEFEKYKLEIFGRDVLRLLGNSKSIGITDAITAPALIPFYDLQLFYICESCISQGSLDLNALNHLEYVLEHQLAIPIIVGPYEKLPDSLAFLLKYPHLDVFDTLFIGQLGLASHGLTQFSTPNSENLEKLIEKRFHDHKNYTEIKNRFNNLLGLGDRAHELIMELIQLSDDIVLDCLKASSRIGQDLIETIFAITIKARRAISAQNVTALIPAITYNVEGLNTQTELDDIELRLSIADYLSIAYNPLADQALYINKVAPYAGALHDAFGATWVTEYNDNSDSWQIAAEIATDINNSVRKICSAEKALSSIAATLNNPLTHAMFWLIVSSKIDPFLAACGAGGELLKQAYGKFGEKRNKPEESVYQVPTKLNNFIEDIAGLARGSYTIHRMRKGLR